MKGAMSAMRLSVGTALLLGVAAHSAPTSALPKLPSKPANELSLLQATELGERSEMMELLEVEGGAETGSNLRGWLGVLGGAICHLALGTTYCWGNFNPYVPTKLKFFDGVGSPGATPDAFWVLPGSFVFQTLAMPIGPWFQAKIGCRATTLLGCWLMALGVFLSSFAPNLYVFMLCYSALFGTGCGLAYTAPMVNGWKWFPTRRGMVSGAVVAGFGSGGFIFNQVGSKIINPSGLNAVDGVFPKEIYDSFPSMLRKLAIIYFTITGIGALLITPPKEMAGSKKAAPPAQGAGVKEALTSRNFITIWLMMLFAGTAGINTAGVYKAFGATVPVLQNDAFQSTVGSLGALFNGAGRLFWGNILDVAGFKKPFAVLIAMQGLAMAAYSWLAQSKAGYLACTCAIFFCLGGCFAMFPAVSTKIFGPKNGATIYGILFSAFSMASIGGTFLTKVLLHAVGWDGIFKVLAGLSLVVLALLSTLEQV
ncbi:unnamed protein product [Chrysoparadoxa australica]